MYFWKGSVLRKKIQWEWQLKVSSRLKIHNLLVRMWSSKMRKMSWKQLERSEGKEIILNARTITIWRLSVIQRGIIYQLYHSLHRSSMMLPRTKQFLNQRLILSKKRKHQDEAIGFKTLLLRNNMFLIQQPRVSKLLRQKSILTLGHKKIALTRALTKLKKWGSRVFISVQRLPKTT